MDEQNQVEIPQSFMAIYSRHGRPNETRAVIEARYDLAEDMAIQTSEFCHLLQVKEDLSEPAILRRCLAGLRDGDGVTAAEADWIVMRVAELLGWRRPDYLFDVASDPAAAADSAADAR